MPLNKLLATTDLRWIPYSVKLDIVEKKCGGCPYLLRVDADEYELGCTYYIDVLPLNGKVREPYLTVSEIAANGCDFWDVRTKYQPDRLDSTAGEWDDPATIPSEAGFVSNIRFADSCGIYEQKKEVRQPPF